MIAGGTFDDLEDCRSLGSRKRSRWLYSNLAGFMLNSERVSCGAHAAFLSDWSCSRWTL